MGYTKEDSERLNDLGLEFLVITEQTGRGIRVYDRTDRQVKIVNEVVEKMQPGIGATVKDLLNGKSFNFFKGQKSGLDINSFNKPQLEYGDLVNASTVFVIEKFGKYNPLKAGVPTFVIYLARAGMQTYALTNNPQGYKNGINTSRGKILMRKRGEKSAPTHFSFDRIIDSSNDKNQYPFRELENKFLSCDGSQYETVVLDEGRMVLKTCLSELSPRTERILRQRFGINGNKCTLEEISLQLKISKERVRQIEVKGLRDLKKRLNLAV